MRRIFLFLVVLLAVSLFSVSVSFGGILKAPWKIKNSSWNLTDIPTGNVASIYNHQADPESASAAEPSPAATSAVPKLFWFECGFNNDCSNTTLSYVDPAASTPVRTTFDSGILTAPEVAVIPTGSIDLVTYHMTNLNVGLIVYAKVGKLWIVDTTTLLKNRMSNEAGFTADNLCGGRTLVDWQTPRNSTIFYVLKGVDGLCGTSDDIARAVKGNTGSTTAPINVGPKDVQTLLFDGTYVAINFATKNIEICESNLTSCTAIPGGSFLSWAETENYDAKRVIFIVDGKLKVYNYISNALTALYTPGSNETVIESQLDRDGFVYFMTTTSAAPFTTLVRKVPVGGGSSVTLATTTTTSSIPSDLAFLGVTPSHVVYKYPNPSFTGQMFYSVPKSGGTPVLLANSDINGGCIGTYCFSENSSGQVTRVNIDGTGKIARSSSQLNGATMGGASDWHYEADPSTLRLFLSGVDNKLKSYAVADDFTNTAVGVAIGTLPVNLNNLALSGIETNVLGISGKRGGDFSFGRDVLFLKDSTAASLKRLTNTNGNKQLLTTGD